MQNKANSDIAARFLHVSVAQSSYWVIVLLGFR